MIKRLSTTILVGLLTFDLLTNIGVLRQRAKVQADIRVLKAKLDAQPAAIAKAVEDALEDYLKKQDALRLPEPGTAVPAPTPEFRATPEIRPFYPDDPSDRRSTPTPQPLVTT